MLGSGDESSKQPPVPRAAPAKSEASAAPRAGTGSAKDRDMGAALRKVYQHAVEEAIPAEMLDLLGKLD